ncbi:hypothetical protein K438DRAFT_1274820 [Mycena galopus ATCC 62051]|nr:hypothetical protein K438DRAFT_1274820 [Mycena galopus ATCC 62051]
MAEPIGPGSDIWVYGAAQHPCARRESFCAPGCCGDTQRQYYRSRPCMRRCAVRVHAGTRQLSPRYCKGRVRACAGAGTRKLPPRSPLQGSCSCVSRVRSTCAAVTGGTRRLLPRSPLQEPHLCMHRCVQAVASLTITEVACVCAPVREAPAPRLRGGTHFADHYRGLVCVKRVQCGYRVLRASRRVATIAPMREARATRLRGAARKPSRRYHCRGQSMCSAPMGHCC